MENLELMPNFDFKKCQVNFVIDKSSLDRLDFYCKSHGITRSRLIRKLISRFLFELDLPSDLRYYDETE